MEINKIALRAFYKTHKDEYYRRRSSSDSTLWDEQYKWDILPALNARLNEYTAITRSNVAEFIAVINSNSNKSNFTHWIDMDDLKLLAELPYGNQILDIVWNTKPSEVARAIDTANNISNSFAPHKKFSPSTWGYILAARKCSSFAIYREVIMKQLLDINEPTKMKGLTQGEKYALLNDSAYYLGELMQLDNTNDDAFAQQALNGQDFLWVTLTYQS